MGRCEREWGHEHVCMLHIERELRQLVEDVIVEGGREARRWEFMRSVSACTSECT